MTYDSMSFVSGYKTNSLKLLNAQETISFCSTNHLLGRTLFVFKSFWERKGVGCSAEDRIMQLLLTFLVMCNIYS